MDTIRRHYVSPDGHWHVAAVLAAQGEVVSALVRPMGSDPIAGLCAVYHAHGGWRPGCPDPLLDHFIHDDLILREEVVRREEMLAPGPRSLCNE